jgi:murein DD-endopeptidase MepM/ murein hydrolase activator NlpD
MRARPIEFFVVMMSLTALPAGAEQAAVAPSLSIQPEKPVNGGVFVAEVHGLPSCDGARATFGEVDVPMYATEESCAALVPVHYDTEPGGVALKIQAGEHQLEKEISVGDAGYPQERLTLPKKKVSGFSEETLERIGKEKKVLDALWVTRTPTRLWNGQWVWPVPGKITSSFGKRRIINGDPRSPHSGTDHRAKVGTPIKAANAGRVALVADQFFAGNLVIVDHGLGLYSMYFHLSETLVKEGDSVKAGDVLGKVGATGRASGPHLHWGLRLLDHRVDPERVLELLGS